jgi:hypothetical protein
MPVRMMEKKNSVAKYNEKKDLSKGKGMVSSTLETEGQNSIRTRSANKGNKFELHGVPGTK